MTKPNVIVDEDPLGISEPHKETAETAMAEAVATRTPRTGINAALDALRETYDEGAHIVWTTTGPRRSHTEEIASILVEFDAGRQYVIALGYSSGAFKLFAEVPAKHSADQVARLGAMFDGGD